jgi:hypothetical protein
MDGAHSRTLLRALNVVKTKERLAVALELPLTDIDRYLSGEKALPNEAFITALDIVAKNNHNQEQG